MLNKGDEVNVRVVEVDRDPAQHEALMQTGEGDHLVVADVLRPGYTLRGRVIRPAGVRVNRE